MDFFCKNASHLFLLCSSTKTFTLSVFLSLQYNLSFSITLFVSLQYILSLYISFSHLRALSLCLSSLPNSLYLFFSLNNILSHNSLSLSLLSPTHITQSHLSHSFKIRPNVEKRWTDVNAQKISLSSCSHFFFLSFTF